MNCVDMRLSLVEVKFLGGTLIRGAAPRESAHFSLGLSRYWRGRRNTLTKPCRCSAVVRGGAHGNTLIDWDPRRTGTSRQTRESVVLSTASRPMVLFRVSRWRSNGPTLRPNWRRGHPIFIANACSDRRTRPSPSPKRPGPWRCILGFVVRIRRFIWLRLSAPAFTGGRQASGVQACRGPEMEFRHSAPALRRRAYLHRQADHGIF
jgi:hypothetical protein